MYFFRVVFTVSLFNVGSSYLLQKAFKRDLCPSIFSVLLTCTSACLKKRQILCLVCFSLNSVTNKEFPSLIFCQNSFALLLKPGLLIPVSTANKFIAAVVKEYFTRLPSRDINSSIYSRAIFRAVMVSS